MILLQRFFMIILNPIYKITGKLSDNIRTKLMGVAWFVLVALFFAWHSGRFTGIGWGYTERGFVGMIPLIIILILGVDRRLKPVKWRGVFCGMWFLCGGILLACSIVYDMGQGFLPFGISMFFLFPCLYFVWNNRKDYNILFSQVSKAFVWNFLIFFSFCIFFAPINESTFIEGRYIGITGNPNTLGMITAETVVASLYLMIKEKRCSWFYIIPCEIAISMVVLSASRTSFLAILFAVIIFLAFFFKYFLWQEEKKVKALMKIVLLGVLIIACFPLNKELLTLTAKEAIATSNTVYVVSAQPQVVGIKLAAEAEDMEDSAPTLFERMETNGNSLDELSSGRIHIWKTYLKHTGIKGHTAGNSPAIKETGYWAHNTFLELAYRGGLLVGVLYFFTALFVMLYVIKSFFKRTCFHTYDIYIAIAAGGASAALMFEMAIFPLEKGIVLLYFVAIAPLFAREDRKGVSNERI